MTTRSSLCACLLFVCSYQAAAAQERSPNFVLILADDQGWNGTSAAMHPRLPSESDYYQTPNLKRLATQGMRFTQGYSPAGLCCPTRRSIQFGQTPIRQGDDDAFIARYRPDNVTYSIPKLLQSVNPKYGAAHFGKWDLRSDLTPAHLGYDASDGPTTNGTGSEGDNGAPDTIDKNDKWTKYVELKDPKRIFSITRRANQFMERMARAERPFFVQISHYATHVDLQMRAETLAKYRSLPPGQLHDHPEFAAMTEDLDTGVGIVLDKLAALGLDDNTYVFYLADNGAVPYFPPNRVKHLSNPKFFPDKSRNYPLRAGKWTVFEGGIRVPFIVRGPGISAGTYSRVPVTGWDLLPTIAELAGYQKELPKTLDGVSFRSSLEGKAAAPERMLVFHRYSDSYSHSAIRIGKFKLVRFWTSPPATPEANYQVEDLQLFDLSRDPGERDNLAPEMPEKAKELEQALLTYLRDVDSEVLARTK